MILQVRFLDPDEISTEIRTRIHEGFRCRIAVAFLKMNGLNQLRDPFRRAKGEIIVGASRFFITDWKALDRLLEIGKANPNLIVKRYFNEGFHPKIFYFENGLNAQVIIGSSNLTGGGLTYNVEANVSIRGSASDRFFQAIRNYLRRLVYFSKSLDKQFTQWYRLQSIRAARHSSPRGRSSLAPDPLPKISQFSFLKDLPLRVGSRVSWWKVAPGRDGSNWWKWKEAITKMIGYVSYGGSKYGNLGRILAKNEVDSIPLLVEKVRRNYDTSKPGFEARQLWMFGKDIRKNDLVVAYSESTIFAVGRVMGKYEYRPDLDPHYPHTRKVQWLSLPMIRPPNRHMRVLATNDTVHKLQSTGTVRYLTGILQGETCQT